MKNLNYKDNGTDYIKHINKMQNSKHIIENLISDTPPESGKYIIGTFLATEQVFAFVAPKIKTDEGDIFIPPKKELDAFHRDTVLVLITGRRGRKFEGEVVSIIERYDKPICGVLMKSKSFYFVEPKSFPPITILPDSLLGAKIGQAVSLKIVSYGSREYMPSAKVISILGYEGELSTTVNGILLSYEIDKEFDKLVLEEARQCKLEEKDFAGRTDLRDEMIFTIDGEYSKDFDDAISLNTTDYGYELGVHIADVSHYVKYDSHVDVEAFNRGTSVYYADKVIPMIPFNLSNEICSLKPNVDRLCFSAFIALAKDGKVLEYRFEKTVINSKYRFTYKQVNEILAGENHPIKDTLVTMNALAKKMQKIRVNRGSLEFDLPEYSVICDDDGNPVDIALKTRGDSEKLIEEFMLCANESAAKFCVLSDFPAVFRVHDNPDSEKLEVFKKFAKIFGYKVPNTDSTAELEKVLKEAQGKPEHKILQTMLLRSLSRARYSENCTGHYGLASDFYLHFTSPIRRYPDLASHRMIYKLINKGEFSAKDTEYCVNSAKKSSKREALSDNASRDIMKSYTAQYMKRFVGETFDGTVTTVASTRIFIEIMGKVEGFINLIDLKADDYVYCEESMQYIGKHSTISLGDTFKIKVVSSNPVDGKIIFQWI